MSAIEVSVVIPSLNEEDTIAVCVDKAREALRGAAIAGEVIVADNGSTDRTAAIAAAHGASVVPVAERGYGSALMHGIAAARGRYIVMADADDSYDFREVPRFVAKLREGFDIVQGCRLSAGGGSVLPGAMPPLHRWIGNPMLSRLARMMFSVPIHDIYCGMRGFTRELYDRLDLRCKGMEFATEMIIKSTLVGAKTSEVPVTLSPDGRVAHAPHLRTFRDGWRTLRFYLLYSPRWLFWYPGLLLIFFGILGYAVAMPGLRIHGIHFDAHTLLVASLAIMVGYESISFGVLGRLFAYEEGLLPRKPELDRALQIVTLERGVVAGLTSVAGGVLLIAIAARQWEATGFANLDYSVTMRWVIPGVMFAALGVQTALATFFASLLTLNRRR